MKKMITNKKARILTMALTAAMAVSTVTPVMAAESRDAAPVSIHTEVSGKATAMAASDSGSIIDKYMNNDYRLRHLRARKVEVKLRQSGPYVVKNWKFYGRKAIGVDRKTGDFIFGKWEVLDDRDNITCLDNATYLDLTADYMQLAFSCDIVWGTDFPYSGVFWNEPDLDLREVEIAMMGGCRTVSVHMDIKAYNEEKGVSANRKIREDNCSSHKEWKP